MTTQTQRTRWSEGGAGAWRGYADGRGVQSRRGSAQYADERYGTRYTTGWLAKGVGWFSVGLGLAQILAPRVLSRMIGVRADFKRRILLRVLGIRELTSGIGILTRARPAGWLWVRVAGDAMDLALLGSAFKLRRVDRTRLGLATASVLGVTALDVVAARRLGDGHGTMSLRATLDQPIHVTRSITINRSVDEIYRTWRNLENLPRFMNHLDSVEVIDERRSRWKARAPVGMSIQWDAEITDDTPNALIAWRSVEGADIPNWGWVSFVPAPAGRGTEVRVELQYEPPAGAIGKAFAKLLGAVPMHRVEEDLRQFKQVMETGDVVRSDASIHSGKHPARPEGDIR